MGEDVYWLNKYLDRYDYIALGGMVKSSNIESWLDKVWSIIMKSNNSKVRIHGFGMTTLDLLLKYPWYSADSSSWAGGTRFARIMQWNPLKKRIYDISAMEFGKDINMEYNAGDPITGEFRSRVYIACIEAYIQMFDYVNERLLNGVDFSHLKSQVDIFDVIEESDFTSHDRAPIISTLPIACDVPDEQIKDDSDIITEDNDIVLLGNQFTLNF